MRSSQRRRDRTVASSGPHTMSPAGLTRGSISFAKTFSRRRWIAGSSPAMTDEGSAVKPVVIDEGSAVKLGNDGAGSAPLGLLRGRGRRAAEGRRFRLLRQAQPAQPQIAALGRELRRTRQFRPPRALGGLGPAIHHVRRHHALSHTTHAANGAAPFPSANAFGAATVAIGKYSSHAVRKQGDNRALGKFRAELWHCSHTSARTRLV